MSMPRVEECAPSCYTNDTRTRAPSRGKNPPAPLCQGPCGWVNGKCSVSSTLSCILDMGSCMLQSGLCIRDPKPTLHPEPPPNFGFWTRKTSQSASQQPAASQQAARVRGRQGPAGCVVLKIYIKRSVMKSKMSFVLLACVNWGPPNMFKHYH